MVDALPLIGETVQTHAGRVWEFQLPAGLAVLLVTWIPMRESLKELLLFSCPYARRYCRWAVLEVVRSIMVQPL